MAQVTLTVNGRGYEIACGEGEEERLMEVGTLLDEKVRQLSETLGQVGEARLLLLAGLIMGDELLDLRRRGAASGDAAGDVAGPVPTATQSASLEEAPKGSVPEEQVTAALTGLAEKLETLASRL